MAQPTITEDPEVTEQYAYRVERFEELGFTTKEAKQLADAKDGILPVWPGRVKKMLDAGCGHRTAVRIFT
jgi:hypothetical protein